MTTQVPYVIDCAHYTVDGMEEDNAGFCSPACACGWKSPPCPDWETAIDGLMQHAYEAGILTARRAARESNSQKEQP